jgi:hypothetical protein
MGRGVSGWSSTWPVVGKTVLERWIERVRDLGVGLVSVVDRDVRLPNRMHTMVDWAKQGVDQILLILLGSYAEIDLTDLVQFHHEGRNRITRVFDPHGPLGINLLDRAAVLKNDGVCAGDDTFHSSRYEFGGYVTRLSSTVAYRKLVQDALEGKCAIQPAGNQAKDKVWADATAHIDPSVQIKGPCYIGARTRLNAGVIVAGYSSVERDCEIDIGTTLDGASVLPNTYLAPGLHVRNSVVDGTCLEHLDHGVTVDLGPVSLSARRGIQRSSATFTLTGRGADALTRNCRAGNTGEGIGGLSIPRRCSDEI